MPIAGDRQGQRVLALVKRVIHQPRQRFDPGRFTGPVCAIPTGPAGAQRRQAHPLGKDRLPEPRLAVNAMRLGHRADTADERLGLAQVALLRLSACRAAPGGLRRLPFRSTSSTSSSPEALAASGS